LRFDPSLKLRIDRVLALDEIDHCIALEAEAVDGQVEACAATG
jgi:hypothetical protein